MPMGIGNLKNLTILSKFVVGPKKGLQLKELKSLPHLQGELFISELQKVEKVRDAIDANLLRKQGLTKLSLHWDGHFGNLQNHEHVAQVVNSVQPHTNLENLTILNYGGAIFPSWLDSPSYSKIVSLCLWGCPNVISLPQLGQLPSLRELSLEGLHAISMIGPEFYGSKRPFASLTTLEFEEMLAWKDWSHYAGGQEEVPFFCLQHLVVQRCPSLAGTLPCQLDRLIKLEIYSCPHLNNSTSVVCLPSLRELYLEDCNKEILKSLVSLTSLTILKIENLAKLVCFDDGFMSYLVKLKELHIARCSKLSYLWQDGNEMMNLTCLYELVIKSCPQFTSFVAVEGEMELPCNLERMELRDCTSLEKLPSKMHTLKHLDIHECPKLTRETICPYDPNSNDLMSQLEYLQIVGCDALTSFPFAKGRLVALKKLTIWECKGVKSLEEITIKSLEEVTIGNCKNLGCLPKCLHTLSYLTHLQISYCPALEIEDFPPLPVSLSNLILSNCPKIKSIGNCKNLTKLEINGCPALEIEDFPPLFTNLSSLRLSNCPKIKSIGNCNNLTKLEINDCPALEIEDFPPRPITLSYFCLKNCPKIKSLPNQWHHLTSLQGLEINKFQNIKCFPKGGLPHNLQGLLIKGCENMKQLVREWGLPMLTSLKVLSIDLSMGEEGEKVCFPSEEDGEDAWSLLFPSSLIALQMKRMMNVERLSSGFRNHFSSLQHLGFVDCPKLRKLPEDGLPPSLQSLDIWLF
ncbi:hypothetical protein BT93_B0777 [Corymbia citriodora subsp. variegata]|nr:hypothetical protein BT93_B0777 [Corymbia citriodora subsp. variegata]